MKTARVLGIALGFFGLMVLLLLEHKSVTGLREENENLRRQLSAARLDQMQNGEHVAALTQPAPNPNSSLSQDEVLELLRLRGEVGLLRAETAGRSFKSAGDSCMDYVRQGTCDWDDGLVLTVDKRDSNNLQGIYLYNTQRKMEITADMGTILQGPYSNSVTLELHDATVRSTNGETRFLRAERFPVVLTKGRTSE